MIHVGVRHSDCNDHVIGAHDHRDDEEERQKENDKEDGVLGKMEDVPSTMGIDKKAKSNYLNLLRSKLH